jgi:murein DD-endopeptidase MepM/ murein hydrolase activator NlpD
MKKLFLILLLLLPARIFADQVSDIQAQMSAAETQRDALLAQQKVLQAQIDAASAQGASLQTTIDTLEASKKKIDNDLKITQSSITSDTLDIKKLTLTIGEKQQEVADQKQAIAESMRQLASYDSTSFLSNLLTDGNIAVIWQDEQHLNDLQDNLQNEIQDLQSAQIVLGKQKNQKVADTSQLADLQSQLSGQKQTVQSTQDAQSKLLSETKGQEASYQALLANNIAQEKVFEDQLFQFESQLKVTVNVSSFPSPSHGILTWPVDKIKITQMFGKTTDSGRLYASGTHDGVDFGTPVGSPVHAVRQGVIEGMGNTDEMNATLKSEGIPGCYSYGRWILIQHDDGLSSIYGHLSSAIVSVGQQVQAGQIIGYSGGAPGAYGSGYSTGPHVHLGLYATDAVKIERYTTSIGCKLESIPIAPPNGYLDPLAYLPSL